MKVNRLQKELERCRDVEMFMDHLWLNSYQNDNKHDCELLIRVSNLLSRYRHELEEEIYDACNS